MLPLLDRRLLISFCAVTCFVLIAFFIHPQTLSFQHASDLLHATASDRTHVQIPIGMQVIAFVFYGRRDRVSILDCYLQENLKRNGGILDEVKFILKTEDQGDLEWLHEHVEKTPGYSITTVSKNVDFHNLQFASAYDHLRRNTIYLKIDDDVVSPPEVCAARHSVHKLTSLPQVFIDRNAIRHLVKTKLEHPEYIVLSANVINNPLLSFIHYHLGAVLPFRPETPARPDLHPSTWKTSGLPSWTGPADYAPDLCSDCSRDVYHRWLPLPAGHTTDNTAIESTEYSPHGHGWKSWEMAAQEHYSFFANMERDPALSAYKFPIWKSFYDRVSVNFICFTGDDVLDNGPMPEGDEEYLTVILPKKTGRRKSSIQLRQTMSNADRNGTDVAIDGNAVVVHYSFGTQWGDKPPRGLAYTDILERYKLLAAEKSCAKREAVSKGG